MTEFEIKSRDDLDDYTLASPVKQLRSVLVRGSILFGIAAVAVAMVVVPAIKNQGQALSAMNGGNLDMMSVGSIGGSASTSTYRVQRSILQNGSGPCLMWPDGRTQGAC